MTRSSIPFFDLTRQYATLREDLHAAFERVMSSGRVVMGPDVELLEHDLAARIGTKHAIAVSSGTDALLAALMAAGIGAGDEVVTTPFTFVATAMAVVRLGAVPVYADVDPTTLNLSIEAAEAAITPRTRAILPVHLFGRCVDLAGFRALAARHHVVLIEAASQAFGARIDGWAAGAVGRAGCFSFFPTKNLGAYGDGGMVTTDDDDLAATLRIVRSQGQRTKYVAERTGGNFRMDTLQAALLRVKLAHIERWTDRRIELAALYRERLTGLGLAHLLLAAPRANERHVYHQFVLRHAKRDALRTFLRDAGIGTEVYYPSPLSSQAVLCPNGDRPSCPEAERACAEVLALPIFPELTEYEQDAVICAVAQFAS